MQEVNKYREYAAACRRLAEKANTNDKQVLLKIAEAWEQQARSVKPASKRDGG